ncbi:MAG: division/cell wall cluster transcriptional repressor MraZ, partial [Agromyces sp.]
LTSRGDFDPRFRSIRRFFTSGAWDTKVDGAGRVALPQGHRDYAGLGKDVAVIGNGNRIELWDAAAWATYLEATESAFADTAEEVIPGLL